LALGAASGTDSLHKRHLSERMAVLTCPVLRLALLAWVAAVAANQCSRGGERCTHIEAEVPEPVRNEAALLQASVGKFKTTLPDDAAAAATPLLETPTAPQPSKPLPPVVADNTTATADNATAAVQPEKLALVAGQVSTVSGQELRQDSWLSAGRVAATAQQMAHYLRTELPDSLVYFFPSMQTDVGAVFGLALISSAIWCTLVTLAACVYRSQKSFPQAVSSRSKQDFNDWTSGPFDFCSDAKVCCWSCWCPCIRWADNMDMLGIVSFWVGLGLFCGLIMLTTVPGGLLLWLVAVLLWMSFRQQLRLKFSMEQSTFRTFIGDCALYCCCWPCAIAQEARHIEEACRAAHPAMRKLGV